jgi:hypothetical protein
MRAHAQNDLLDLRTFLQGCFLPGGPMSTTVWLAAKTAQNPQLGGHFWVYLNWAMGLRALGCDVVWLEMVNPKTSPTIMRNQAQAAAKRLQAYGFTNCLRLCSFNDTPLSSAIGKEYVDLSAAGEADLLLNMVYGIPSSVIEKFRRTALIDIDPGLTQIWVHARHFTIAAHDVYFTTGETVGRPGSLIPDCGLQWHYVRPCVALDAWPVNPAQEHAPFTTISNWYMDEWIDSGNGWYINDKRSGFMPFVDLPEHTALHLELALNMKAGDPDKRLLLDHGWSVTDAGQIAKSPEDYQRYIQQSRGEFSCVKPSCVRLQNAWISDRTLCYLASGKPAVVQHTGKSRFLPEREGLFRFHNLLEATHCLERVTSDYDNQCRKARMLAEEYFDAAKVAAQVLKTAFK